MNTPPANLLLDVQAGFQGVQLGPQDAGQLVAEPLEPLDDLRDLRAPLVGVDAQGGLDVAGVGVEAGQVERAGSGHRADRAVDRFAGTFDAFHDPLQDARVLTEAGPEEPAVVAAPEPVHVEDLGQLGRVAAGALAHLYPVPEVVAGV